MNWVIFAVLQHPCLWSRQDELACHIRRYTREKLHSKLHRAGFVELPTISVVSLLFPAMHLSRRYFRGEASEHDDANGLEFNRPLNALLAAVMALEFGLIRLGVRVFHLVVLFWLPLKKLDEKEASPQAPWTD